MEMLVGYKQKLVQWKFHKIANWLYHFATTVKQHLKCKMFGVFPNVCLTELQFRAAPKAMNFVFKLRAN